MLPEYYHVPNKGLATMLPAKDAVIVANHVASGLLLLNDKPTSFLQISLL